MEKVRKNNKISKEILNVFLKTKKQIK